MRCGERHAVHLGRIELDGFALPFGKKLTNWIKVAAIFLPWSTLKPTTVKYC